MSGTIRQTESDNPRKKFAWVPFIASWVLAVAAFAAMPDGPLWRELVAALLLGVAGMVVGDAA